MASDDLKAALDRVLTWPPEDQREALEALNTLEELRTSAYQLSDDQIAEVHRRRAEDNPNTVSLDDAFGRFESSR